MRRLGGAAAGAALALLIGCQPPTPPSRPTADQKKAGLQWALMLADPTQEQAPATHTPVERWRTHHLEYLNSGLLAQDQCMSCHQPDTYCNRCHQYVGAKLIEETPGRPVARLEGPRR